MQRDGARAHIYCRALVFGCLLLASAALEAQPRGFPHAPRKSTPPKSAPAEGIAPRNEDYIQLVKGPHDVQIQDNGSVALDTRLSMIERAQKDISIESYIFKADQSGCLILNALIKKARQMRAKGKKFPIRLMLDKQLFGPDIDSFFVHEMAKEGIEMRYYNVTPAINMGKVTHRNHKKTFMIDSGTDNGELILGGRNIGDEYFDMHKSANFTDMDVHVEGAAVSKVQKIYDRFWNSAQVTPGEDRPDKPRLTSSGPPHKGGGFAQSQSQRAAWERSVKEVNSCLADSPEKQALRSAVSKKAKTMAKKNPVVRTNSVLVASDTPDWKHKGRTLGDEMYAQIAGAKKSVIIENPYFIPQDNENDALKTKIGQGVKMELVVNSRKATPEFGTTSIALYRAKGIAKAGGEVHLYKGSGAQDRIPGVAYEDDVRWATHSKTMVVDGKTTYVGSGNFDPRSINRLNSEIGLIFPDSPELAKSLTSSIRRRISESTQIDGEGRGRDGTKVDTPNYINILQFIKVGGMQLFEDQL